MTNEVRNDILFDAMLKVAVSEGLKKEIDTMLSNEELNEKYKPSTELDGRIRKIINRDRIKSRLKLNARSLRKIAVCMILIVGLSSITLLSVEATRYAIFNAFIEQFGKYTKIQFQDSVIDSELRDIYRPTYIPESYKEKSTQTYGNTVMLLYSNDTGKEIIFKQWKVDAGTALIDNENTKYKEIEISGNKAYLFEALTKDDYSVLLWHSEGLVFELTSQISSDELIRIGDSIKKFIKK